jgi:hypothetical protein
MDADDNNLSAPAPRSAKTQKPHHRFARFIKKHWKAELIVLAALLALAGVIVFLMRQNSSDDFGSVGNNYNNAPPVYYARLTGRRVETEADETAAVTAIMIENSPDARPQSGLKNSGVVFEAIAEGGITRFLVLYQSEKPQLIGPVRSVRLYYVDWLTPFDASVAHVGGSAAALQLIRSGDYRDIDQFFNGDYYWRADDRYAPHNVYTSFEKLDALNAARGYTRSDFDAWPRQSGKPIETPDVTSINVTISGPLFNSSYTYDPASNQYLRSQTGEPHTDREEGQISPDVVVVMKVQETMVMEDGWRESITTTGSGPVYVFQNGTLTLGTWNKASREAQIEFLDQAGSVIKLGRGQTWITAVPENHGGDVQWQ